MFSGISRPKNMEDRQRAAKRALRRGIIYLVGLGILLYLILNPEVIVRHMP